MTLPKVLIVDDRQFDRILYKEFLGEENYLFTELDDGENILEAASSFSPDLIILDWQMPRVSGLEALKMIKKNQAFKNIPVIIITGLEDEKVLEEAFDFGSIDFLNKPVTRIELNARVLNAINLQNAIRKLALQKEELESLNVIIKDQKQELEKSLVLKTERMEMDRNSFESDIDLKNKKLLSKELDSTKLINDIKSIRSSIQSCHASLKKELPESTMIRKLNSVLRDIDHLEIHDNGLSDFKETFESIDPEFYKNLSSINPRLTPNDLKNCAYIKMNLDNYEVANILNVELKSLQMTRYRLKKKLNLDETIHLREFIMSI
jgi:DNA-binding response OmpR family regulator